MPSIGIGIGVGRGGGVPAFTPGSYAGLFLQVNIGPSWCFTDTAGTTPCSVGDTVMCVTDQVAGYKFTLAAAKSTDRTLQQDASGKYYLSLGGGANDYLYLNPSPLSSSLTQATLAVAVRPAAGMTGDRSFVSLGNNTNTFAGKIGLKSASTPYTGIASGSGSITQVNDTGSYTGGNDRRLILRTDTTGLQTVQLYKDGVSVASTARTAAIQTSTTGAWCIGDQYGYAQPMTGRLYGFLLYTTDPGDAGITQIDTYLKGLMP